ncbi:MAG: hypothetical protein LBS50_00775 [Prevotellaceae bacterium]|nr:hypothetical protein [Prevotellaceae bacterium]
MSAVCILLHTYGVQRGGNWHFLPILNAYGINFGVYLLTLTMRHPSVKVRGFDYGFGFDYAQPAVLSMFYAPDFDTWVSLWRSQELGI